MTTSVHVTAADGIGWLTFGRPETRNALDAGFVEEAGFCAIGLSPDSGTSFHLTRALGGPAANAAFVRNRRIPAAELAARGLADVVAPDGQVRAAAARLAAEVAGASPAALLATRRLVDAQRAYLVGVARQIVAHGSFRAEAPSLVTPPGLEGTLGWFKLLDAHLEDFVAGRMEAGEIIAQGGGRLWETFQAHDLVCAVFGHGVARALAPMLPGADVLELGTGTGGTTRRMAADLTAANRVVLSDLRQSFLDRVAADLPGVALETAILDINEP